MATGAWLGASSGTLAVGANQYTIDPGEIQSGLARCFLDLVTEYCPGIRLE
jgi:hypothetical protein